MTKITFFHFFKKQCSVVKNTKKPPFLPFLSGKLTKSAYFGLFSPLNQESKARLTLKNP